MAMTKIINPSGWNWDRPVAQMVKLSSRGLTGSDRSEFIKTASHVFVDMLDNIKLAKDEVPVHLVALGATEFWGCFFAGAPVATYDGQRAIETIETGDMVLTHRNRYCAVSHVYKKSFKGTRASIRVQGLPDPVVATGNHPFMVIRAKDFGVTKRCLCWNKDKPGWTKENAVKSALTSAQFISAAEIKKGDYVVIPVNHPDPAGEQLPSDLAYVLGVYLAEGCISDKYQNSTVDDRRIKKSSSMVFSMSLANDTEVITALRETVSASGHILDERPTNTSDIGWRCEWYDTEVADLCIRLFGRTAKTKRLHPVVFAQSIEWKLQFLAGYFDGDGCLNSDGTVDRYTNTLTASTVSRDLALDLQQLLATLLIPASVCRCHNRESNGCFGRGDLPIFSVSIGSAYSAKIVAHCRRLKIKTPTTRKSQARGHTCGDYLLLPIKHVHIDEVEETIYNLEVEQDNTYVVDICGHNSNRNADGFKAATCKKYHDTFVKFAKLFRNHKNHLADKDPYYGNVKLSAYNDAMHRVELLTILNASKEAAERNGGFVADKELEKLGRGDDLPVSMACRLQFDICEGCGNKARTRAEYCDESTCKYGGCKHNLGKVAEDGFVLHVDNPDPTFFDISHVFRPADRIAYGSKADYLAKAASHIWTPGAEMAEALGVTAPLGLYLRQEEPEHWNDAVRGQMKLARALALAERNDDGLSRDTYRAFSSAVAEPLTAEQFDVIGQPGTEKAAAAVGEMADCKVVMSLRDFARWTGRESLVKSAASFLPCIYQRLIANGNLEQRLLQNPFACYMTKNASHDQRLMARTLVYGHSLDIDAIRDRSMRSVLKQAKVPNPKDVFWNEKLAADEPAAVELAEDYGLYKLAVLHRVARFDRNFKLTASLAIGQNKVVQ